MKKYKIGYTQGSYDMFHIGHLNILKNAKSLCDYLIVGVNSDSFMKEYKNKSPIIPENERYEIIKHIDVVDEVHIVDTRDKIKILQKYPYNVLVMGNDNENTDFYKNTKKKLNDKGVDVVFFPHTDTTSSSQIREKLGNY